MAGPAPVGRRISGVVLLAILLVAAALLLFLVWITVSPTSEFWALIGIGWIALLFALVAYLARSFTPDPVLARATSLGFAGMGFTVLAVTVALFPAESSVTTVLRIVLALLLLGALVIAVLGFYYGSGQRAQLALREEARETWRAQPTSSAFDYPAAHPPSPPPIHPPPPRDPGPPGGGT